MGQLSRFRKDLERRTSRREKEARRKDRKRAERIARFRAHTPLKSKTSALEARVLNDDLRRGEIDDEQFAEETAAGRVERSERLRELATAHQIGRWEVVLLLRLEPNAGPIPYVAARATSKRRAVKLAKRAARLANVKHDDAYVRRYQPERKTK